MTKVTPLLVQGLCKTIRAAPLAPVATAHELATQIALPLFRWKLSQSHWQLEGCMVAIVCHLLHGTQADGLS